MIIRPSFTVLGGTAIGLVAGVLVYGTVSTASAATTSFKPAKAIVTAAPAPAARCAAGQKLEDGVCVIHVEQVVVVAAPSVAGAVAGIAGAPAGADPSSDPAESSDDATEVADDDVDEVDDAAKEALEDRGGDEAEDDDSSDAAQG